LSGGGISLNFRIDYEMLNQKMAEFLDKHTDEINQIVAACLRVDTPDPVQRMREIKGPITSNLPDEPFAGLFGGDGKK